ncbi:hypothetical protein RAZWK3B_16620 [Roseobacter sp. AzwK-3b]|uniref:hypothetical protein n=1 Tax=Roseobacter sp. AzwK-3b TaxID=351016 RepID=UPI000156987D|nr:hypothetical protein [Roseobacter sp. AzwK-3b]EDM71039.1 hypothetical protein RAZWK3B_16620 [Roseobacter sp. AzwK-3b]
MRRAEAIRGDTFIANGTYTDDQGVPVNLTGYSIACQAKGNGATLTLTSQITDAANGQYTLTADPATTRDWEPGDYLADIEYTLAGVVSSTDRFVFRVLEDVTNAD